jgi:hypothetical protein
MTIIKIDNSQRTAAKVAGWSGLITFAIVVFGNYALLSPLFIPGDAAQTAQNIVAHQTQLRVAVVCFLPFFGLAATICAYLWLKSNYIPKGLAVFGVISSAWCVICAFVFLIFPHFNKIVNDYWFDSPMAIFEMVLSFWLLFKGLKSVEPNQAQAGAG